MTNLAAALKSWQTSKKIVPDADKADAAEEKPVVKQSTTFVNLHHHDEYSLRTALGNVKDGVQLAKARGLSHYAVSNYGELSGWVSQYFACLDSDITPILGIEVSVNDFRVINSEKKEKVISAVSYDGVDGTWKKELKDLSQDEKDSIRPSNNLLLYAHNIEGYYNIIKCHNNSQLEGFYEKPRVSNRFLSENGKGIIAVSPCPSGKILKSLMAGKKQEAKETYELYKQIFDSFYLELTLADDERYVMYNQKLVEFAEEVGAPLIIGLNSHYLNDDDEEYYEMLLKIGPKGGGANVHLTDKVQGRYYRSYDDVLELYHRMYSGVFSQAVFDKCMDNVKVICQQIGPLELDTTPQLPRFPDAEKVLREKSKEGLKKRGKDDDKKYIERLEYELDNVIRAGFADYFLFLDDITIWCENNGVLQGPGRGSATGSLVLYALGVTQVDPVRFNLLFERFLDATRLEEIVQKGEKVSGADLPDVDIDYSDRDRVKQYLVEKYGKNNTCSIGTIGRMKNKSVLIDLSRALDIELQEVYDVTQSDEMKAYGVEEEKWSLEQLKDSTPSLAAFFDKYPEVEKYFIRLRGTISFWGKHAGGVLVSDKSLTDQLPVRHIGGKVVSSWMEGLAGHELGRMGYIKMDILGVETLNQLQTTLDLIKQSTGQELKLYDLPLENDKAFSLCNKHDNLGIFQFDGHSSRQVIKAMGGIKTFEDYSHASALMRPSALQARLHTKFGERRKGTENYYLPDCLKEYLGTSHGLTIYQESAYHVAHHLCDFSIVDAYRFMKLLYKAKMKPEMVPEWRDKFMKGAQPRIDSGEVKEKFVIDIFEDLLKFQGYGFPAAHSTAYAVLSAWGLYLKAHFFPQFMCCLLMRTDRAKQTKRGENVLELRVRYAKANGLKIYGPSVNKSMENFSIQDGGIRFGLSVIKGIKSASSEIVDKQPFKSVEDFCERVSSRIVHKSRFESLVFAGAFDEFGDKESIFNWYHQTFRDKKKLKENKGQGFLDFFEESDANNEDEYESFTEAEIKKREKEALGFLLSHDILLTYDDELKKNKLRTLAEVKEKSLKQPKVLVEITSIVNFKSKKSGLPFYRVGLTDGVNDATLMVNEPVFESVKGYFKVGAVLGLPTKFKENGKDCYLNEKEDIIDIA